MEKNQHGSKMVEPTSFLFFISSGQRNSAVTRVHFWRVTTYSNRILGDMNVIITYDDESEQHLNLYKT